MKTKLFLGICLSAIILFQSAAQPALQWASTLNGPAGTDKGNAITLDASGNLYVTGSSDGLGMGSDYLTIKYNSDGDTLWTRRYNGSASGADVAVAIKVDNSDNVYITGKSQGSGTGFDIVTVKYNSSGVQQWVSSFNGGANADDIAYNLAVDVSGNVYVVGSSFYVPGSPYSDGIIVKYNSSGAKQWEKQLNIINKDVANLVAINNSGNIIVSIYVYRTPSNGGYNTAEDGFVIFELNPSNGAKIFEYIGTTWYTTRGYPYAMVLDGSNNIYVTSSAVGMSNYINTAKFNHFVQYKIWGNSLTNPTPNATARSVDIKIDGNYNVYVLGDYVGSNHDYLTLKLDANGQNLFFKSYNSLANLDDTPIALSLNTNTNPDIYVAGFTTTADSTHNITTVKYDNNGNQTWAVDYDCGNNGDDIAAAMVKDNYDNIYVTGYSSCDGTSEDVKTIKYCASAPSALITPSESTICQGESTTLAVNTCAGCSYLWSSGQTTPSILVSPTNTTNFSVTVTNTIACSATSLPSTITVLPLSASVNVAASSTAICAGQNVIFTATPTNGGTSPAYQWFINGNAIGTGSTFSTPMLTNGAQVYCVMTSNALCVDPPLTTSNTLIISVNPLTVPGVSVAASSTSICSGENVTFTATPTNDGVLPSYEWYLNGMKVGDNNLIYSTSALTNGSQVYCRMTSNAVCANPAIVNSDTLIINVNPLLVPGVNVTASSTSICAGENIMFTATPTNGGTSPTYQWYVNDTLVEDNNQTYSISDPANGLQVYCTMASNAVCVDPVMVTSNSLTITVNPPVVPSVSISAPDPCTFTANPTNGGTSPFYQWYVDNVPAVGVNNQTYSNTTLENGSEIYCIMTSNADCANPAIAKSNSIIVADCIVGTNEHEKIGRIVVFPNPASDFFTIEGKVSNSGLYIISLYNILGQAVVERSIWLLSGQELSTQLKVEGLSGGNYYIVIYSEMNTYTIAVQKQ